ncbi:MAG: hypothetical protein NC818_06875 [Candidatus Omnitrophica bacterium]|nr:hypothetical protein [Candidatus Omnitrophota bacterium]
MFSIGYMWLSALIYAAILLTLSFFVLVAITKVQPKKLMVFGYIIFFILLLISAIGIYVGFSCRKTPVPMRNIR